jgi:transcriptional regulator with XRE-family HTH domain
VSVRKRKNAVGSDRASRRFQVFLRNARTERGYSQAALASLLGYESAQYVSDWERGVSSPPMKKLAKLAEILAVDMDRFFDHLLEVAQEKVTTDLSLEYARIRKRNRGGASRS